MCGIVAMINKRQTGAGYPEGGVLRDLMTAGTVRGHDGAGLFYAKYDELDAPVYMKTTERGAEMFRSKGEWDKMAMDSRFVVGHNRAATSGELIEADTHPFVYTNVVGVHNGTVRAWRSIFPKATATMDSSAIFEAIDGVDEDPTSITGVLSKLRHEAYALVWYDIRTNYLHLARNSQRPLNLAMTDANIWIASEKLMLAWIMGRNTATVQHVSALATHSLLSIPMDGKKETMLTKYEPESYAATSWAPYQGGHGWERGESGWQQNKVGNLGRNWSSVAPYDPTYDDGFDDDADWTESYKAADYPRYIDVRNFGTLPWLPGIKDVRPILYDAIHDVIGMPVMSDLPASSAYPYLDLSDAMSTHMLDVEGIHVDAEHSVITTDLVVVKTSFLDNTAMGYIVLNKVKYPCSVHLKDDAMVQMCYNYGSRQFAAVLEGVSIVGVRLYHSGEIHLLLEDVAKDGGISVVQGKSLEGGAGLTECLTYGTKNPACTIGAFARKVDWKLGWAKKVTVSQDMQVRMAHN